MGESSIMEKIFVGADGGTRTHDLRITNALLYQLSHISIFALLFTMIAIVILANRF